MSATVKSDISGLFGALAHNGVDAITFDSTGILPGSYKDGSIVDTDLALSANSAPVKTALNAAGGAPIFACRAWVNFNGTGTVAISASGNVSSITDNGTGDYTVNFTTALPDANYQVSMSSVSYTPTNFSTLAYLKSGSTNTVAATKTTTQLNVVYATTSTSVYYDCAEMNVAIFR